MVNKKLDLVIKNLDITNGSDKIFIKGYANKYKDENGNLVIDRSGEVIPPQNYNLTNFMKNPVLLYQHNQEDIIGKVVNVNLDEKGLEIEAVVYKELNPKVFFAIQEGILKAFSVGFLATDYEETDNGVWVWKNAQLVEVSIVSIPDNQDSLFSVLADNPCQNGGLCLMSFKNDLKKKEVDILNSNKQEKEIHMEEKAIKNSVISEKPWSEVDKIALGQKLAEMGKESYIKECYLVIGDIEKRSTWKFPHHELDGNDLVVNKNGVVAAYQALRGARQNPNISPTDKKAAAKHLLKHYREMIKQEKIGDIPQDLQDIGKELELMVEEFDNQIEKAFKEVEDEVKKELPPYDTKAQSRGEKLGKDKINQIINDNQGAKLGDAVKGGKADELIVNVTPNSILTAYPNPPMGYIVRRYLQDDNQTYDFIIGKSEVAKLLALMKNYFKDRDENGNKKELSEDDLNLKEILEIKEKSIDEESVENYILEKSSDKQGLNWLFKLYGDIENLLNTRLAEVLA